MSDPRDERDADVLFGCMNAIVGAAFESTPSSRFGAEVTERTTTVPLDNE